jgi:peptide deformylase
MHNRVVNMWKPTPPPYSNFKKDIYDKAAGVADIIYQVGEFDALRKSSPGIPRNDISSPDMQKKFTYIKYCLTEYRERTGYGRGITGVQVGVPERFSVIYTPEKLIIIVNPSIVRKSDKMLLYPEMCMSMFPVIAPVVRPAWIEFEYLDEQGSKLRWDTKDDSDMGRILNRVFQHEIDHMDGIINTDLVRSPKDLLLDSDPHFYEKASFEKV